MPSRFGERPEIGGLLILISIILVLGLFQQIMSAGAILKAILGSEDQGLNILSAVALLLELGLFTFGMYTAVRFFGKRSNAPLLTAWWFGATLGCQVVMYFLLLFSGESEVAGVQLVVVAMRLFWVATYVLYFRYSERVKATFVR